MLDRFRGHALKHYRKDGRPTGQVSNFDQAMRPLLVLYGELLVKDFGPLKLEAVRELMVKGYTDRTGKPRPGVTPRVEELPRSRARVSNADFSSVCPKAIRSARARHAQSWAMHVGWRLRPIEVGRARAGATCLWGVVYPLGSRGAHSRGRGRTCLRSGNTANRGKHVQYLQALAKVGRVGKLFARLAQQVIHGARTAVLGVKRSQVQILSPRFSAAEKQPKIEQESSGTAEQVKAEKTAETADGSALLRSPAHLFHCSKLRNTNGLHVRKTGGLSESGFVSRCDSRFDTGIPARIWLPY